MEGADVKAPAQVLQAGGARMNLLQVHTNIGDQVGPLVPAALHSCDCSPIADGDSQIINESG